MSTMKIEAIIFDCDGTLVQSEELEFTALSKILESYDISVTSQNLLASYRGLKLSEVQKSIQEKFEILLRDDFVPTYRKAVYDLFETDLKPIRNAYNAVKSFELPMCVASNAPLARVQQALRVTGFSPLFSKIYSAYEVGSWKPAPELFLHAANQMNVKPRNCAVVEDSDIGISAAIQAGMQPFYFSPRNQSSTFPFKNRQRVIACTQVTIIRDMTPSSKNIQLANADWAIS